MTFAALRAKWRAAMRGKSAPDGSTLDQLFAEAPPATDQAIFIYPTGVPGEMACRWVGISATQAANVLYQMADQVIDQKVAPDPRWSK